MSREGTWMKVARVLLLLGVGLLAFLRGATAQTCTTGSKAVAIFVGVSHPCALLDDATLKCWGINTAGALGLGDTSHRGDDANEMGTRLPSVDLGAGRAAVAVSGGTSHACALLNDTTVKCWGGNEHGQLGLGDTLDRGVDADEMGANLPSVNLGAGRTAVAVSAGNQHTCALLDDAAVKCWGWNINGNLGLGDTANRGDKANVIVAKLPSVELGAGRTTVAVIAGGHHTCALLDDATLKCWGFNADGELGLGDTSNRGDDANEMGTHLPSVDLGAGTAAAVSAGARHTCVLLNDTTVKCWGGNEHGQLGLGDTLGRGDDADEMGANLPSVDLGAGRTAVAVSAGSRHTCALLDDATVKCWGINDNGQLGLGDASNRGDDANEMGANLPSVQLGAGRTAVTVIAGAHHTCALLDDATVKCWGVNADGQLGLGHTSSWGANANGPCPPSSTTASIFPAPQMGDHLPAVVFCGCSLGETINVVSVDGSTSMSSCACAAGFTGDAAASGGSCAACTAGTYKSVIGAAACASCPNNAVSAEGSVSCGCPAGFTGDAASGESCTACAAGTYTSGMGSCSACPAGKYATAGSADCSSCPSGSSVSVTGSLAVTACICSMGYTGGDGGPCTECGVGTFKDATGSAACAACPSGSFASGASSSACTSCGANTASAEGSTASSGCGCARGFWGDASAGGIMCTACASGTYKDSVGVAECSSCPEEHPQSVPGSTAVGGCVKDVSVVTFSARVPMSKAEFEAEATTAAYISGVATALRVAESSVSIVSVVEQNTGRRRKLLLTSVVVETSVIVSAEQATAVSGRITTDNLNSALSSAGISVDEVSGISTVTGTAAFSAWGMVGIAVGGVALVAASVVWRRRRSGRPADELSGQVSALLGYEKVEKSASPDLAGKVLPRKHLSDAIKDAAAKKLRGMVEAAVKELGGEVRVHSTGKFSPLVFGKFDEATTALEDFLHVDSKEHLVNMARGEFGIVAEIEKMVAGVRDRVAPKVSSQEGGGGRDEPAGSPARPDGDGFAPVLSKEDKTLLAQAEQLSECLDYVLHQEAGSSDLVFQDGGLKRDCDTDGNLLPSREIVDSVTGQKRGMRFDDFVDHPSARLAALRREQVLALRLYTTVAYLSINNPLRDQTRQAAGCAHPLPVTVTHILKGVLQLRKIEASEATAHDSVDLYRGLASRSILPEFFDKGGTELAPMSTTRSLKVALQYAASEHAVILRLQTKGFMGRGVDIAFLSCFPAESEVLFPPLTYLGPVREKDEHGVDQPKPPLVVRFGAATFTIVDVQPQK